MKSDAERVVGRGCRYLATLLMMPPLLFIQLHTHARPFTDHSPAFMLRLPVPLGCHTYSVDPFTVHFTGVIFQNPWPREIRSGAVKPRLGLRPAEIQPRGKGPFKYTELDPRRSFVRGGALRVSGRRDGEKSSSGRRTSGYWSSRRKHGELPVRRLGRATRKLVSLLPRQPSVPLTPTTSCLPPPSLPHLLPAPCRLVLFFCPRPAPTPPPPPSSLLDPLRFAPSAILASSSRSAAPVRAARARELLRPKAGWHGEGVIDWRWSFATDWIFFTFQYRYPPSGMYSTLEQSGRIRVYTDIKFLEGRGFGYAGRLPRFRYFRGSLTAIRGAGREA